MHLLEVEDLVSGYGKTVVVNRVSFSIDRGQVVGIVGPNGAGKTTLVRTVLGYLRPLSGRILYKGGDITGLPAHRIAKLGIGYVPERGGILKSLTVRENIELALNMSKYGRNRIKDIVKLFKILEERQNQIAGTLSGGEQRMLSIATAVLITDELIVLDEPSSGLAPIMRKRLVEAFKQINRELGISLIVTEQDPTVVLEIADTVYVMEMGSVVRSGKTQDIIKPEVLKEYYLGM
ncbi:MAG: ABC transporter ATP-binding protein [Sulfolobales archaeon]|nr:ABC transporter ATP-binding protein [Sulfolobales archaeon]MDW8083452.1 ABC transporter ATP-binding protein [Sulfolobales archaeon]